MENINSVKKLTRASMLLAFAFIIIFIGSRMEGAMFNQVVVGPLVNAVILTTVLTCDLKYGVLVSLTTPVLALITGQFPTAGAPFIPFIMIGNAVLAIIFFVFNKYIKTYGAYAGIVIGALFKTLVLTISIKYLVELFKIGIPKPLVSKLTVMMSYPQFYSAVAGGVVALIFCSIYLKMGKR